MKKSMIFVGLLAVGFANAQTAEELKGRVGINTQTPKASLDITRHTGIPETNVQGLLLPNLTQEQRNKMTKASLTIGLQIFNTDKNCVDWWNGKTWQCMDGMMKDNHGDAALFSSTKEWWSPTDITLRKNNCPVGMQAKANASVVISYTQPNPNPPIKGEGTAVGQTQGDADDRALEIAKADFYRKAQEYVNGQFGSSYCEALPIKDPDRPVIIGGSGKVVLEDRAYWFSSIDDDDYLPLKAYQGPATLEKLEADGVASGVAGKEPALKVEGKIPSLANAIQVFIPIRLTQGSNVSLSEHIMHIEIPAEYTADGRVGIATFTWNPVEINSSTRFIPAKFYAKEEIKLKGLDLIGGLGDDHKGIVIGTFKYPKTSDETTQAQWTGKYELRLISGILDKNFMHKSQLANVEDYRHRFVYIPVQGPDGRLWLNNNLGADYANINHTAFNPGQQAKTPKDHHAYGSLGQWGRRFNGRELMNWTSATSGTPIFKDEPGYNWFTDESAILVWEADNCPEGWHTPTETEFKQLHSTLEGNITYPMNTPISMQLTNKHIDALGIKFTTHLYRRSNSGSTLETTGGAVGGLWTKTQTSYSNQSVMYFPGTANGVFYYEKSTGFVFRCVKD